MIKLAALEKADGECKSAQCNSCLKGNFEGISQGHTDDLYQLSIGYNNQNVVLILCGECIDGLSGVVSAFSNKDKNKDEDICGINGVVCSECQPVCDSRKKRMIYGANF